MKTNKLSSKVMAWALTLAMVLALVPVTASAATAREWNGTENLIVANDDTVDITDADGGEGGGTLTVPDGAMVTIIGTASDVSGTLKFEIGTGTVNWEATLSGSTGSGTNLVQVSGSGVFEVTDGGITQNGAGSAIDTDANIIVSGGTVSARSNVAIYTYGDNSTVTVSGGTVSSQDSIYGSSAICSGGTSGTVIVTGGVVRAQSNCAIDTYGASAQVTVTGGVVFGYTADVDDIIYIPDGFSGPTGTGIVIAWDNYGADPSMKYGAGDTKDLSYLPNSGATVCRAKEGDTPGISYKNDTNEGFIEIDDITVQPSVTQDNADITAAKSAVEGATYATTQALTPNEAAALAKINEIIGGLTLNGVTPTVTKASYTAPVAGTSGNINGTDASYTFTVKLNKGAGTQQTTATLTLNITATVYDPTGDNNDIAAAKGLIEASTPATVTQAAVNTEGLAKTWLVTQLNAYQE